MPTQTSCHRCGAPSENPGVVAGTLPGGGFSTPTCLCLACFDLLDGNPPRFWAGIYQGVCRLCDLPPRDRSLYAAHTSRGVIGELLCRDCYDVWRKDKTGFRTLWALRYEEFLT